MSDDMGNRPISGKRQNVVLILFDSMRYRNVSSSGYHRKTTPTLDSTSSSGARFTSAIVQAPFTVASTTSILTGVYPSVHNLQYYGERLAAHLDTLPELLQRDGYDTAAFISNPHINIDSGLTRGFNTFTDGRPAYKRPKAVHRFVSWAENGHSLNQMVKRRLSQRGDKPFFYFIFYVDTHVPFSGLPRLLLPLAGKKYHSPNFDTMSYTQQEIQRVIDLYDSSFQRGDRYLAELQQIFAAENLLNNTATIISADHGEGIDIRKNRGGHGRLYDAGLHVPLTMVVPQMTTANTVVDDLVMSLDLAPTICEIAGVEPSSQFQGQSLVPNLTGHPQATRDSIISEYHDARSVRTKDWKYIEWGSGIGTPYAKNAITSTELYYLPDDPYEENNIVAQHPKEAAEFSDQLCQFVQKCEQVSQAPDQFEKDQIVVERLRGLGYIE